MAQIPISKLKIPIKSRTPVYLQVHEGTGNVDLYSTSSRTPLTRSDMDHTVLHANNTISAFTRKPSHVAPPRLLLIYRPQEDEWLSWL